MGALHVPVPARAGRAALVACVGLLAGAAWLALAVFGGDSHGLLHLGAGLAPGRHAGSGGAGYVLLFLAGWTLMCVAMMLPTSLPVLATFRALASDRPDRRALTVLVVVGYLTAWVGFGVLVYGAHLALALAWMATGWPAAGALGASALLVLAGAFQFSSLKYRCLDQCRSPLAFVLGYWQGRREKRRAFDLGFDSGLFCVGCCWALMLLMFLVGTHQLAWMLVLGTVMAVEKNVSWGRRLSAPLGAALIVAGVLVGALGYRAG
jgi:predicted metal-binding membrane protein